MTLRKLHALSAVLIVAFVCAHIINHLAGLAGADTHVAFMEAARSIYRFRVIEVALLGCIAFQIVSGLTLLVRGWKQLHGFVTWLQAISGAFLAFFLIVHVASVLFGRAALGLDTNFYFAAAGLQVAPFQFFFAPYYFLAVIALFTHVACAGYGRSRNLPRVARILIVAIPSVIGVTVSMLIVLSLAGVLFPVEIPVEYKETYALPRRQSTMRRRPSAAMNRSDPIRRVSVVSTGTVQIHPQHMACTWQPTFLWVLMSRRWTAPRPINVFVIEHRDALVLFDTGQDRASVTDPRYFPSGLLMGALYRMSRFDMAANQTLSMLLKGIGYRAGAVGMVVLSHLHGDHIGGLREVSHAELLVSRAEWETLSGPWPELAGVMRRHIELPGLRWRQIELAPIHDPALAPFATGHDLFGDGSLMLVPTPGHTAGSISMIVRRAGRPTLALVGDLTYGVHLLDRRHVPGVGNRRLLRRSTAMLNQLRQANPGLVVLATHDPGAATALAEAGIARHAQ